ncbi:MAG: 6-phosphogluconolactonase [Vicinamibacterales bacterium]
MMIERIPRMAPLFVEPSPAAVAARVASRVADAAGSAVSARGRLALAVAGGSVATTCLPALATVPLDWARTRLFFVDERLVPAGDPESNAGLVRRMLPPGVPIDEASIHSMPVSLDARQGAAAYEAELVRVLGRPPVLDVVLLGVGEDGHVGSVFPAHAMAPPPRAGWLPSRAHRSRRPTVSR